MQYGLRTCRDVPHLYAALRILRQHVPPVGQHSRVLDGRGARGSGRWLQLLCCGAGACGRGVTYVQAV